MTQALYEEQNQPEIFYILHLLLNCMSFNSHECNFMWFINQFGSINTPKKSYPLSRLFCLLSDHWQSYYTKCVGLLSNTIFASHFSQTNTYYQYYVFRKISFPKVGDYIGHGLINCTDTKAKWRQLKKWYTVWGMCCQPQGPRFDSRPGSLWCATVMKRTGGSSTIAHFPVLNHTKICTKHKKTLFLNTSSNLTCLPFWGLNSPFSLKKDQNRCTPTCSWLHIFFAYFGLWLKYRWNLLFFLHKTAEWQKLL